MYITYSDPQLAKFYEKMTKIQLKKYRILAEVRLNPDLPIMHNIAKNPHFAHNKIKAYSELLEKYYTQMTFDESVKDKSIDKLYSNLEKTFIYKISDEGEASTCSIFWRSYKFTFNEYKVNYKELNKVKDEIIAERSKFFKNKKKICELIEHHKKLRKEVTAPSNKFITTQTDKVFLETFSYEETSKKDALRKHAFAVASGWLSLPPYFFDETLYDLKSNEYKRRDVSYYVHFLPEASLAIILKDLQAESGESFFKSGVTKKDVEAKVMERAAAETDFIKNFNIDIACQMFNERLKTFVPDNNKKTQSITIEMPYMGLDKLDETELKKVARQIFDHYSLFDRYNLYADFFKNGALAKYNREYEAYVTSVSTRNSRMNAVYDEFAAALPGGRNDLPYLNLYFELLDSGRFQTYYELCDYVVDVRYKDEMRGYVRKISNDLETIQKQNEVMISNQIKLYQQNANHQRQLIDTTMSNHRDMMAKLDKIENNTKNQEIIIYW